MWKQLAKPLRNIVAGVVPSLGDPVLSPAMIKILQISPPIACQAVFLAPMSAMRTFKLNQTTGSTSPLPYTAMVANGYLWTTYGILLQDPTIQAANISGLLLGVYYTWTFSQLCPKDTPMKHHYAMIGTLCSVATAVALCMPAETAATIVGLEACGVVMVMFSGPLASIRTVLETKSTASLPFAFTLATIGNCIAWSGYGALVIHDPLVWVPNSVGLIAGLVQLGLFARFGIHK